jgi:dihydroflavonol-4-reductase
MNVLITGASGLLGSHLCEQFTQKGHKVFALFRKLTKRSYLFNTKNHKNIVLIQSELDEFLKNNFTMPIDVVINCTACVSSSKEETARMKKINTDFVKELYQWCEKQNVSHFISLSSTACLGAGNFGEIVTENSTSSSRPTAYSQSKLAADIWLEKQNSVKWSIIYPGYMLGKWDSKPSSGAIFFALKMKKLKAIINHTKNFVACSDVARGIVNITESKLSGKYILGGYNHPIQDFLKVFSKITQFKTNDIEVLPSSHKSDSEFINEFCLTHPLDISKAKKDFSYTPTVSLEEMIKESLEFFAENRMLRFKNQEGVTQ